MCCGCVSVLVQQCLSVIFCLSPFSPFSSLEMGKPKCFYTPHLKLSRPSQFHQLCRLVTYFDTFASTSTSFHPALLRLKKICFLRNRHMSMMTSRHFCHHNTAKSLILIIQKSSAEFQRMMTLAAASFYLLEPSIHQALVTHECWTTSLSVQQQDNQMKCGAVMLWRWWSSVLTQAGWPSITCAAWTPSHSNHGQ